MNLTILKSKKRVKKSIEGDFEYHHLALSRSNEFLRKHDSERVPLFVLYADLVESTKMSGDLSPNILNVIIRIFSQEMSYVIEDFSGYVLKFVGDAVLAYFPVTKKSKQTDFIIKCAKTMHQIVDKAINPILKEEEFPQLKIKVTIDFGDCSVVRYGADKYRSHIDLIGLTLNLASKMQSYSKPGETVIGESVFDKSSLKTKKLFKKKQVDEEKWIYCQLNTEKPYLIYYNI